MAREMGGNGEEGLELRRAQPIVMGKDPDNRDAYGTKRERTRAGPKVG